jgi:hypothetical protein
MMAAIDDPKINPRKYMAGNDLPQRPFPITLPGHNKKRPNKIVSDSKTKRWKAVNLMIRKPSSPWRTASCFVIRQGNLVFAVAAGLRPSYY